MINKILTLDPLRPFLCVFPLDFLRSFLSFESEVGLAFDLLLDLPLLLLLAVGAGRIGKDIDIDIETPMSSSGARAPIDSTDRSIMAAGVWYSSAASIARLGRVARTYASASVTNEGLAARAQSVARTRKRGRRGVIQLGVCG